MCFLYLLFMILTCTNCWSTLLLTSFVNGYALIAIMVFCLTSLNGVFLIMVLSPDVPTQGLVSKALLRYSLLVQKLKVLHLKIFYLLVDKFFTLLRKTCAEVSTKDTRENSSSTKQRCDPPHRIRNGAHRFVVLFEMPKTWFRVSVVVDLMTPDGNKVGHAAMNGARYSVAGIPENQSTTTLWRTLIERSVSFYAGLLYTILVA